MLDGPKITRRALCGGAVCGAISALGCGGRGREPATEKVPLPDTADRVAQELAAGQVIAALHLDRMGQLRLAGRLATLGDIEHHLKGTGIDPGEDIERIFIASRATHSGDTVAVIQHHMSKPRVEKLLRVIAARETGAVVSGCPFPASIARSTKPGETARAITGAPHPNVLVIVPEGLAFGLGRFVETGGLPGPAANEAALFRAWDPALSVQSGPVWSDAVRFAEASLSFDALGGAELRFRAVCNTEADAAFEAEHMAEQVDDAQSVHMGGLKLRLFDYVPFEAKKQLVRMRKKLSHDEVTWLVAMAMQEPI